MPPRPCDVELMLAAGDGRIRRPVVLAGEGVPVRLAARVAEDRALAGGVQLQVRRPDGITVTLAERDLARVALNAWEVLLCLDVPGAYELSATCRTPSPARAVLTLMAQAAPGDAAPPAAGTPIHAHSGLVLTTQDGRPLTTLA